MLHSRGWISNKQCINVLESFQNAIDVGSMFLVTNENILKKVNYIDIVIDGRQPFFSEQYFIYAGYSYVELYPITVKKEHFTSEQFVKKASERPDITGTSGTYFFTSVVLITLFLGLDGKCEHLGRFNVFGTPVTQTIFIIFICEHTTFAKICKNNILFFIK